MPKHVNGHSHEEETITFSPEQMELIREGDEAFENGKRYTPEQVMEHARAKVRAWMQTPSQSA